MKLIEAVDIAERNAVMAFDQKNEPDYRNHADAYWSALENVKDTITGNGGSLIDLRVAIQVFENVWDAADAREEV